MNSAQRPRLGMYVLNGHEPIPCEDANAWSKWFESADRRVAVSQVGDLSVSTVFIGIDHNFGFGGGPELFETMVFSNSSGDSEDGCWRYSTWEQAEAGHKLVTEFLQHGGSLEALNALEMPTPGDPNAD